MKKLAEQYRAYIANERRLFEVNRASIAHINHSLLRWMLLIAAAISMVITVCCFLLETYRPLMETYLIMSAVFLVAILFQNRIPDDWVLPTFYGISLFMMSYASYSSAVLYPETIGVLALGIIVVMPSLILDKSRHINGLALAIMVFYLIFVMSMKLPDQRPDEFVYIISFTLVGMMLGAYLRRVRLENLELLRLSRIRETTDVLTGLHNRRRLFDFFIECESGRAKQPVTGLSILDIDFFKTYNDTYGHLAGDNCLKAIGTWLAKYGKRHNMEFYRYGGEEFVAIAHEPDRVLLEYAFKSIPTGIASLELPHEGKKEGIVTMSQGVFLIPQQQPAPGEELPLHGFRAQQYLSKADEALYQAKQQGRNRTIFYTPTEQ